MLVVILTHYLDSLEKQMLIFCCFKNVTFLFSNQKLSMKSAPVIAGISLQLLCLTLSLCCSQKWRKQICTSAGSSISLSPNGSWHEHNFTAFGVFTWLWQVVGMWKTLNSPLTDQQLWLIHLLWLLYKLNKTCILLARQQGNWYFCSFSIRSVKKAS